MRDDEPRTRMRPNPGGRRGMDETVQIRTARAEPPARAREIRRHDEDDRDDRRDDRGGRDRDRRDSAGGRNGREGRARRESSGRRGGRSRRAEREEPRPFTNPLVQAATPLLMLAAGLRGTADHHDVAGLYEHILEEIGRYEEAAADAGCSKQTIMDGRYTLCTFIDEAVMNTPWGCDSIWASKPLSLRLHGNTKGGENVFEMIEEELHASRSDEQLLELFYVCLSLGFEGRYRVVDNGPRQLADIRDRIYRRIRDWRDAPILRLSDHWHPVEDRRSRLVREVPAWVMALTIVVVSALVFFPLRTSLSWAARPVIQKMNGHSQATFNAVPCKPVECPSLCPPGTCPSHCPVTCPTLASRLEGTAPDELTVIAEPDGKSVLVVKGSSFASGSADVPQKLRPLLGAIAAAIKEVGGTVQVEGHSDNQPIRSMKFKDNYDLSEARARNAARLLEQEGGVSVGFLGLASDQPRYLPENLAANRDLNRRIEIVHRAGSGEACRR
ncbi:MAG TPA: type IVB secretion system protein IcmH/DotU [Candidatus Binatia bacterium]|nr:type IVB secretion system protein IcmH/DotU [Candidatus Binatia bacterium]